MILPKLSAAILATSMLGSAYDAPFLARGATLDQWVVISGATNGVASLLGVDPQYLIRHRLTAYANLTRYAAERGQNLEDFDLLFERGQIEGRKLIENHMGSRGLISSRSGPAPVTTQRYIVGFMHDSDIGYHRVRTALAIPA